MRRLRTAGIPIYRMDARELGGSLSSIGDIVFIVHSVAYVSVEESLSKPELYFNNNAMTTLSIAKLCTEKGIPIVYFSSAAVYGEPLKLPIGEDHSLRPQQALWRGDPQAVLKVRPQVHHPQAFQCLRPGTVEQLCRSSF